MNKIYCKHTILNFFSKDKILNNYIMKFLEILTFPIFKKLAMNSEIKSVKKSHNILLGKILTWFFYNFFIKKLIFKRF